MRQRSLWFRLGVAVVLCTVVAQFAGAAETKRPAILFVSTTPEEVRPWQDWLNAGQLILLQTGRADLPELTAHVRHLPTSPLDLIHMPTAHVEALSLPQPPR